MCDDAVDAVGFEVCLVKSWKEWEQIDPTTFLFHDCVLNDEIGLGDEAKYHVSFFLDEMVAEIGEYDAGQIVKRFMLEFQVDEVCLH